MYFMAHETESKAKFSLGIIEVENVKYMKNYSTLIMGGSFSDVMFAYFPHLS